MRGRLDIFIVFLFTVATIILTAVVYNQQTAPGEFITDTSQDVLSESTSNPTTYPTNHEPTSCTYPPNGCGDGYWDTLACACKLRESTPGPSKTPYPTNPYYPTPTPKSYSNTGSESNTTYVSYPTSTPVPYQETYNSGTSSYSSGSSDTYYSPYPTYYYNNTYTPPSYRVTATPIVPTVPKIDRLASESEDRIRCVKALLSPSEYERMRFFLPPSPEGYEEIRQLGKKVRACWNVTQYYTGTQPTTFGRAAEASNDQSPLEKDTCLVRALGETSYKEIYEGMRHPTYQEHLIFTKCYGKTLPETVIYATNQELLSDYTGMCLRDLLKERYEDVKSGKSDIPYELREPVDRCFGVYKKPFQDTKRYEIPDEIKSCLAKSVGQTRFAEIASGKSQPTEEEKNKGTTCFEQLNKEQTKFLPPPVEQVPFIEEKTEVVKVADVQETAPTGGKVVFAGKGPPNATVTLYIYSEPIVVTTKTDENGDWVYELDKPLEGEKHVAYAAVRSDDGAFVRSSVFNFSVVAAEQETQQEFVEVSKVSDTTEKSFILKAGLMIAVMVFLLSFLGFQIYKDVKKRNKESD